jgi:hypothetical protein
MRVGQTTHGGPFSKVSLLTERCADDEREEAHAPGDDHRVLVRARDETIGPRRPPEPRRIGVSALELRGQVLVFAARKTKPA